MSVRVSLETLVAMAVPPAHSTRAGEDEHGRVWPGRQAWMVQPAALQPGGFRSLTRRSYSRVQLCPLSSVTHMPSVLSGETICFTACRAPSHVCRVVCVEAWPGACPTPCMPHPGPAVGLEKQVKVSVNTDLGDTG